MSTSRCAATVGGRPRAGSPRADRRASVARSSPRGHSTASKASLWPQRCRRYAPGSGDSRATSASRTPRASRDRIAALEEVAARIAELDRLRAAAAVRARARARAWVPARVLRRRRKSAGADGRGRPGRTRRDRSGPGRGRARRAVRGSRGRRRAPRGRGLPARPGPELRIVSLDAGVLTASRRSLHGSCEAAANFADRLVESVERKRSQLVGRARSAAGSPADGASRRGRARPRRRCISRRSFLQGDRRRGRAVRRRGEAPVGVLRGARCGWLSRARGGVRLLAVGGAARRARREAR